jgi:hypothetical protein
MVSCTKLTQYVKYGRWSQEFPPSLRFREGSGTWRIIRRFRGILPISPIPCFRLKIGLFRIVFLKGDKQINITKNTIFTF